jgi:hypothetical protein
LCPGPEFPIEVQKEVVEEVQKQKIDEVVDDLFYDSQYDFQDETEAILEEEVEQQAILTQPEQTVDFDIDDYLIQVTTTFEEDGGIPQHEQSDGGGLPDNPVDMARPKILKTGMADHNKRPGNNDTDSTKEVHSGGRVGSPSTYEPVSPGSPTLQPQEDDSRYPQLPTGAGTTALSLFRG